MKSLIETASADVLCVCEEEQALELDRGTHWKDGLPFTCNGLPLHVIHSEPDKVWVSCVQDIVPGMRIEQARLVGSLLEIFAEFGSEWGKRWMRHEQVDAEAWRHLAESFQDFTPFPSFEPSMITAPMWRAALRMKSPKIWAGSGWTQPSGLVGDAGRLN